MAFLKDITTPIGVAATYWRVCRVRIDFGDPTNVHYALAGYASEAARRAGAQAMREEEFSFVLADDVSAEDLDRAMLYDHARQAARFAGAKDA